MKVHHEVDGISLQPRAGPSWMHGTMMVTPVLTFYGMIAAWFITRGDAASLQIGYAALGVGIFNSIIVMLSTWRRIYLDERIADFHDDYTRISMRNDLQAAEDKQYYDYATDHRAEQAEYRAQQKHRFEMTEAEAKADKALIDLEDARDAREQKKIEVKLKQQIAALKRLTEDVDSYEDIVKKIDTLQEAVEKKGLAKQEIEERADKLNKKFISAAESINTDLKDLERLQRQLGPDKIEELVLKDIAEQKKKEKSGKRGLPRSSPTLVEEITTSCETEYCHRKWYTRSYPDLGKRDGSRAPAIHEFHITPPDFDFDDIDGGAPSLEKRIIGDIYEEDCVLKDGPELYARALMQEDLNGGDASTSYVLAMMDPEYIAALFLSDINKIGYENVKGYNISRFTAPGKLNCARVDLSNGTDHGNLGRPALNLAVGADDTPQFQKMKAEDMMSQCIQIMADAD